MRKTQILFLVFLILSFVAGYFLSDLKKNKDTEIPDLLSTQVASTGYTCPMHSHINKTEPGQCPVCNMSLVKIKDKQHNKNTIHINPAVLHNFGIKTNTVKKGTLYRELLTYGYVSKIESVESQAIKSPVSGEIVFLAAKNNSAETEEGELLVTIKSAEWKNLQQLYLNALDKKEVREIRRTTQLLSQAGFKLKQVQQLKNTRKPTASYHIYAPMHGIVKDFKLSVGQQLSEKTLLFSIAPVYPIIGYAEIFEGQWRWLTTGHKAKMIIRSVPGVTWQGEVLEVDDILMNRSRTIKTRLGFKVQENVLLKAGMQANFTIFAAPKHEVIYVPQNAVIRTADESRVMLSTGNGRFKPVLVKTGLEDGKRIEIVEGLQEGQEVVTSGQFLLDSESQLHAELIRMQQDQPDRNPVVKQDSPLD